jgi:pyrroloquinoline quinone (PQQ) biosynthesis protein C
MEARMVRSALQEKLDQICREHIEESRRLKLRDVELTPARGRLIALQRALFNKNRRDCWGAVQCSAPIEVKRVIWSHEEEELIRDPRCGSDHYSLHVRRCMALGLTREEIENGRPLPSSRAAFYAWLYIARTKPWLQALSSSSILERDANMMSAMGEMKRQTERWKKELGLTDKDMEVSTANENADGDHAGMMADIFDRYATLPELEAQVLEGARESLEINRTFIAGLAEAARRLE